MKNVHCYGKIDVVDELLNGSEEITFPERQF